MELKEFYKKVDKKKLKAALNSDDPDVMNQLVVNRSATSRQFKRLREREGDADGFCLGLLGQVKDAQERAMRILA